MKKVAVLHFHNKLEPYTETVQLLGQPIELTHYGCESDVGAVAAYIQKYDGEVTAVAVEGAARQLRLGKEKVDHEEAEHIFGLAEKTPVVDGQGILAAMERWAVRLIEEERPGFWAQKRILMVPGLNHGGLSEALQQYAEEIRYADPMIYFSLPGAPGVGSPETLEPAARTTLPQLKQFPYYELFPGPGEPFRERSSKLFEWADYLVGDMGALRRYGPDELPQKTVVTTHVSRDDLDDLRGRGVSVVVTTLPALSENENRLAQHSAATFEACLVALRPQGTEPLTEDTYLNLLAELKWEPTIHYLKPEEVGVNRFSYVTYPLSRDHLKESLGWAKFVPSSILERTAAYLLPYHLGNIRGIVSPTTGQKAEGYIFMLGGTPEDLNQRDSNFIYRRLMRAAQMSERLGAQVMGVGAFAEAVGEASHKVSYKTQIAITSGNSLTVAATLEAAKRAVIDMDNDIDDMRDSQVLVIGGTQSIGAVCARLLAEDAPSITVVANTPEQLIGLKQVIEQETPAARVQISTSAADDIQQADLIVLAATNQPIDIMRCKAGAVICDIARPPNISKEDIERRPDVLVIGSGEVLLPGNPQYSFNMRLPAGAVHACLAETALLALEGRFEDFTTGTNVDIAHVREIYDLYRKHQLTLSGIRTHDQFISQEEIAKKRALAEEFRSHPEKFQAFLDGQLEKEQHQAEHYVIGERSVRKKKVWLGLGAGLGAVLLGVLGWFFSQRDKSSADKG